MGRAGSTGAGGSVALPTTAEIATICARHRITEVGVASADVLERARTALHERKAAGLHGEMQFTYRNPDRSTDPRRAVPGAESVIVAARPYLTDDEPAPPPGSHGAHARVARYSWVDHYEPLRVGLREVAARLVAAGHRALVFADDNSIVDRAVARRAGIGWFGKNANLLIPGAGSWFVLGCVVTTAPYEPAGEPVADGCGSCVRCLEGCPTQAIVAPGVVDARRCLSWILQRSGPIPIEYREAVHDRIYGCDDCQEVCPISVRLGPRTTIDLDVADPEVQSHVDLLELLDSDDEAIERRHGRWYIAERDMTWLRRNALIVIGNVADPRDRRVLATVDRYRAGPDPLLAEHADWALRRLDDRRTEREPSQNT
ncbi:tRNA epoxyqueuosine(34) reductase QueG [Ilumatobacter sp.]|uniref:tRNA epoxyqueuosine(34) reductase QueG n=1 Tax=Ilumatobacter sp. TaxID=1967498 RepID=UPI003B530400